MAFWAAKANRERFDVRHSHVIVIVFLQGLSSQILWLACGQSF